MAVKKVKNCDIFTVSMPRKSSDFIGLLPKTGISKNYGNFVIVDLKVL